VQASQELHWLPILWCITFKLTSLAYKNNYHWPGLTFTLAKHLHEHAALLNMPCISTDFGKRTFVYTEPNVWDNVATKIKSFTYIKPTYSVYSTVHKPISTHLATARSPNPDYLTPRKQNIREILNHTRLDKMFLLSTSTSAQLANLSTVTPG